jgi:Uma2 family endonuclease
MEASAPLQELATAADLAGLEHHEVIDGHVVRKASPSFAHGDIQGELFVQLREVNVKRGGGWWLASEVEIELAPHQVYLPDVAGWRVSTMATPSQQQQQQRPMRIRPDWVCEILSPSTGRRDLGTKRDRYRAAGVGHYWIVDPLHGVLTVLRNTGAAFEIAAVATADEAEAVLEPFAEVTLDLRALFTSQPG